MGKIENRKDKTKNTEEYFLKNPQNWGFLVVLMKYIKN